MNIGVFLFLLAFMYIDWLLSKKDIKLLLIDNRSSILSVTEKDATKCH